MKKVVVLWAVVALAALTGAGSGSGAGTLTWRVVKSKSVSGQFASTGISATIRHPKGIAVRFRGSGVSGMASWGCSKGFSVSSWSRSYSRGFHALGHVRGKDSCDVVASIAGQGRITVQILKAR
jgi:hypothetical protein